MRGTRVILVGGDRKPGRWWIGLVAFALLSLLACAAIVVLLDPAFVPRANHAPSPQLALLNALPGMLLALLLLAVMRRPWLSLLVTLGLAYLLYTANAIKLDLLDTPLVPADFLLLRHLGDGGALLARYVSWRKVVYLLAGAAMTGVLLAREPPWSTLRGVRRAALFVLAATLCASLVSGLRPWPDVYAADGREFLSWSPSASVRRSGLPITLLRYTWSMAFELPEPDRAAADRLVRELAPAPSRPASDADLPDIVVVQSESFFDPARLRGFEPSQTLPELRRLQARSRHGDLYVPTYGGGTIRTEFEVLTGIAMRYFPTVQYPYFRLTTDGVASLASVLAGRGYRTIAVHPHARAFWNRASALRQLGFAAFDDEEAFEGAPRVGYYVGDEALVDHVLQQLDEAKQPLFLFVISMENHGPYEGYPNADPAAVAAEPVPDGVTGADAREMQGYLHHLRNADRSLGRLADALRARDRRTLLLFYGDHLPALPRIWEKAGFDDGVEAFRQPAPWLLFDSAHPVDAASEPTAAFYLPAVLLSAAGVSDPYFDLLEVLRRRDRPSPGWAPPQDEETGAWMRMRQRGEALPAPHRGRSEGGGAR